MVVLFNWRYKRYDRNINRLPMASRLSRRKRYTGTACVARMNRVTEGAIFSFKIRKKHVPIIFTIKIRRGETGEKFRARRRDKAKPHHEKIKGHFIF
jgi:hypothetical protein